MLHIDKRTSQTDMQNISMNNNEYIIMFNLFGYPLNYYAI